MDCPKQGVPLASHVNKYISRFPVFEYRGTVIQCKICNVRLIGGDAFHFKRHIKSKRHMLNLNNNIPYREFLNDFIFMLSVCNIPQHLVSNEHFRLFWAKYVPSWKLPTSMQLRYNLPRVQGTVKECIKDELKNKKICLCVDDTTDAQKHGVIHVVARPLKGNDPAACLLLTSRRIEKSDVETIVMIIKDSLKEFCITGDQVTMLVTDGAPTMLKVGRTLKTCLPTLLHITCLIHACHLITETIRKKYPMVNNLITSTKKVFAKSPKHIRVFKQLCPKLPPPPQSVITRWGTWLQAVCYYHKYFANVKDVILEFKSSESVTIRESQQLFSNWDIKLQIEEIFINYSAVVQAISLLQNSHLSLRDSLNTLDNLQVALESLTDPIGLDVAQKFRAVLNKNPDLQKVRFITENKKCTEEITEYLDYANPTSLDVERSLSKYTKTFSDLRRRLSESSMEALLMLQFYAAYRGSSILSQRISARQ